MSGKRSFIIAALTLATVLIVAEIALDLNALRSAAHPRALTTKQVGNWKLREILAKTKLLTVTPNHTPKSIEASEAEGRYQKTPAASNDNGIQVYSLDAETIAPENLPSSLLIDKAIVDSGLTIFSIAIDDNDLQELLNAPMKRGLKWERPVYASLFRDRTLYFASGAGLRIHGGKSRLFSPVQSYKLYFRNRYGSPYIADGVLFNGAIDPVSILVVHNDIRGKGLNQEGSYWHFANPMAYEIAAEIGCFVPHTEPALLFLNGKQQGIYVLTEYIGTDFLRLHFGHDRFTMIRTNQGYGRTEVSRRERGDLKKFETFRNWIRYHETPLDFSEVRHRIDLDNLTKWLMSVLFCATTDAFQGKLLLDQTDPQAKWFWVNWDMDHSFMDIYRKQDKDWELDTFGYLLSSEKLRGVLLKRLLTECPEYQDMVKQYFADILNHRLTPSFLGSVLNRYRHICVEYGIEPLSFLTKIDLFFRNRPATLRRHMTRYLDQAESFQICVTAPSGRKFKIDSYQYGDHFDGWYFKDMTVHLEVSRDELKTFSHWLVNGKPIQSPSGRLEVRVTHDLDIEAKFLEPVKIQG